jgi:hypothetical protein
VVHRKPSAQTRFAHGKPGRFIFSGQQFLRKGGNVYQRSPYVVAAAMRFDARIY